MTEVHEEIWRDVPGYEGRYLISNTGREKHQKTSFRAAEYIEKQCIL